jgi:hypothetical protein
VSDVEEKEISIKILSFPSYRTRLFKMKFCVADEIGKNILGHFLVHFLFVDLEAVALDIACSLLKSKILYIFFIYHCANRISFDPISVYLGGDA